MKRRPGQGGGGGSAVDEALSLPDPPAPAQDLQCRACGTAGSPPTIKPRAPDAGAVLTIGTLHGRFALPCNDCSQRIALEAAARRGRGPIMKPREIARCLLEITP
jgi:hypothetical protein